MVVAHARALAGGFGCSIRAASSVQFRTEGLLTPRGFTGPLSCPQPSGRPRFERNGCRPHMPLGFESVTHIRMWKPQGEWIGRSVGVRAKYMSEVTFGNVGTMSSMLLEAEPK